MLGLPTRARAQATEGRGVSPLRRTSETWRISGRWTSVTIRPSFGQVIPRRSLRQWARLPHLRTVGLRIKRRVRTNAQSCPNPLSLQLFWRRQTLSQPCCRNSASGLTSRKVLATMPSGECPLFTSTLQVSHGYEPYRPWGMLSWPVDPNSRCRLPDEWVAFAALNPISGSRLDARLVRCAVISRRRHQRGADRRP